MKATGFDAVRQAHAEGRSALSVAAAVLEGLPLRMGTLVSAVCDERSNVVVFTMRDDLTRCVQWDCPVEGTGYQIFNAPPQVMYPPRELDRVGMGGGIDRGSVYAALVGLALGLVALAVGCGVGHLLRSL